MSEKRTIGFGKVRITTYIGENHPVYAGVMEARELLGGSLPDHVSRTVITEKSKRMRGGIVGGECSFVPGGRSRIIIYAGSIDIAQQTVPGRQSQALRTTLHEIGHSGQFEEVNSGIWLDAPISNFGPGNRFPSISDVEERARN